MKSQTVRKISSVYQVSSCIHALGIPSHVFHVYLLEVPIHLLLLCNQPKFQFDSIVLLIIVLVRAKRVNLDRTVI